MSTANAFEIFDYIDEPVSIIWTCSSYLRKKKLYDAIDKYEELFLEREYVTLDDLLNEIGGAYTIVDNYIPNRAKYAWVLDHMNPVRISCGSLFDPSDVRTIKYINNITDTIVLKFNCNCIGFINKSK